MGLKRRGSADHSVSSTMSADACLSGKKELGRDFVPTSILLSSRQPSDLSLDSKKSVRFEEEPRYLPRAAVNRKSAAICWYGPNDYIQFKESFKEDCKKFHNSSSPVDCTYRRVVTCAFTSCTQVQSEIEHDSAVESSLCEADQRDLYKVAKKSVHSLGLEKMAIQALFEDKKGRRAHMVSTIMKIQNRPSSIKEERIRRAMQAASRPSRIFAWEMAKAHMGA